MHILDNHKKLFTLAFLFFVLLSLAVVILPAINNQRNNAVLPNSEPLSEMELAGKRVFISNGCVACHSQQVRNVAMDKAWGSRPGIAADYAGNERMSWWMNTATLMGTERTGPDLTNIGHRLPSEDWHLLHLYNPRAVAPQSIMPAYPWMFEWTDNPKPGDKVIKVPAEFSKLKNEQQLVAKNEAVQLVAYLLTLKQTPLPSGVGRTFLYEEQKPKETDNKQSTTSPDGSLLYATHCQVCHQANGEGLKGAFPPLKGSSIVLDDKPDILIEIIMNGYNAREEFAEMPPVGQTSNLSSAEVAAIANHERTSWGNNARLLTEQEVNEIIELIKSEQ